MQNFKKTLAGFLAGVMAFTALPVNVFANPVVIPQVPGGPGIGTVRPMNPNHQVGVTVHPLTVQVPQGTQFFRQGTTLTLGTAPNTFPLQQGAVTVAQAQNSILHNDTRSLNYGSDLQLNFHENLRRYLYNFHYVGGPLLDPVTGNRRSTPLPVDQQHRYVQVDLRLNNAVFHWESARQLFPNELRLTGGAYTANQSGNPTALPMLTARAGGGAVYRSVNGAALHSFPGEPNRAMVTIPVAHIVRGGSSAAGGIGVGGVHAFNAPGQFPLADVMSVITTAHTFPAPAPTTVAQLQAAFNVPGTPVITNANVSALIGVLNDAPHSLGITLGGVDANREALASAIANAAANVVHYVPNATLGNINTAIQAVISNRNADPFLPDLTFPGAVAGQRTALVSWLTANQGDLTPIEITDVTTAINVAYTGTDNLIDNMAAALVALAITPPADAQGIATTPAMVFAVYEHADFTGLTLIGISATNVTAEHRTAMAAHIRSMGFLVTNANIVSIQNALNNINTGFGNHWTFAPAATTDRAAAITNMVNGINYLVGDAGQAQTPAEQAVAFALTHINGLASVNVAYTGTGITPALMTQVGNSLAAAVNAASPAAALNVTVNVTNIVVATPATAGYVVTFTASAGTAPNVHTSAATTTTVLINRGAIVPPPPGQGFTDITGYANIRVPMPIRTTTADGNVQVAAIGHGALMFGNNTPVPATNVAASPGHPFFPSGVSRLAHLTVASGNVNLANATAAGRTTTTSRETGTHRNTLLFDLHIAELSQGSLRTNTPESFNAGTGTNPNYFMLTGAFEIVAPTGFRFPEHLATTTGTTLNGRYLATGQLAPNNNGTHNAQFAGTAGQWIRLANGNLGLRGTATLAPNTNTYNLVPVSGQAQGLGDAGWITGGTTLPVGGPNSQLRVLPANLGTFHYRATVNANGQVLRVEYRTPDNNRPNFIGSITLDNVVLQAQNLINPSEGAVYVQIRNVTTSSPLPNNNFPETVTPQTGIYVGTTGDWRINMEVIGDTPDLISGRLVSRNVQSINGDVHRAARVRVNETIADSWWSERVTTFNVSEGVRIREVVFRNVRNVNSTDVTSLQNDRHFNLNRTDNPNVRVNHGNLQIHNLRRQPNALPSGGLTSPNILQDAIYFYMDIYLNVPADFYGPINLYLGEQVSAPNAGDTRYVTIANANPPISVDAQLTNVRVGYQFMPVGNFTITENMAGGLLNNEQVFVSITDGLFSELQIAPNFTWEVTEGNIEISTPEIFTGANVWQSGIQPNVVFTVDAQSTVASTINFTNVTARLAAVAPASTYGYDLVVWGPGVAQNFNHELVTVPAVNNVNGWVQGAVGQSVHEFRNVQGQDVITGSVGAYRLANQVNPRDLFSTAGISDLYITLDGDLVGHPTVNEIITMSAEGVITVGGQTVTFEVSEFGAPTIVNDALMIPARIAIASMFGLTPQESLNSPLLHWNAATSTFTVDGAGRNIQLTVGSQTMMVGGIPTAILAGEGATAVPTQVFVNPANERMYLPGRALGEALGFTVSFADGVATFTPQGFVAATE